MGKQCDTDYLDFCDNEADCLAVSGCWFNGVCQKEACGEELQADVKVNISNIFVILIEKGNIVNPRYLLGLTGFNGSEDCFF